MTAPRRAQPGKLIQPVRAPASAIDAAVDTVYAAKRQQEWEDTVRLAEALFPKDWNVRVEQFSDGAFVQLRMIVSHGRDPIDALKKAIDWYRRESRLVIPSQGQSTGRKVERV